MYTLTDKRETIRWKKEEGYEKHQSHHPIPVYPCDKLPVILNCVIRISPLDSTYRRCCTCSKADIGTRLNKGGMCKLHTEASF